MYSCSIFSYSLPVSLARSVYTAHKAFHHLLCTVEKHEMGILYHIPQCPLFPLKLLCVCAVCAISGVAALAESILLKRGRHMHSSFTAVHRNGQHT